MINLTAVAIRNRANAYRSVRSGSRPRSLAPTAAPTTAPTMIRPPAAQSTLWSMAYPMTPATEIGTIAPSDVPCASRWPIFSTITSPGTTRIPPPIPNNPDRNPAARPTATVSAKRERPAAVSSGISARIAR